MHQYIFDYASLEVSRMYVMLSKTKLPTSKILRITDNVNFI
jgi:hypothetical protein